MSQTFLGLANLDLLSVGIAVAGMAVMGFAVYFSNRYSSSNRVFLGLALVTSIWGLLNYLSYQPNTTDFSFFLLRLAIFFGVISSFFSFTFAYTFPLVRVVYANWYLQYVMPISAVVSLTTLTPFVFRTVTGVASDGHVISVEIGPGIYLFALTVVVLNISAVVLLIRKLLGSKGLERSMFFTILAGMFAMLILIVVFNLILPAFFQITYFTSLGALFLLPFIAMAAYAILRQRLFNIKVTGTALLVFALSVVTFGEVVYAHETSLIIYRGSVFILVLIIGVSLIRGVVKEVRQREQIEVLATNLKIANERLKELDRLKSEFLSIASHDLRTPLTIVRNFMSLLLDGTYGKLAPAAEEGARQVFDRATDMAKSVDSYLNVSRIEQGRMKYDFVDADFSALVQTAANQLGGIATKKGLAFNMITAPGAEHLMVRMDTSKMNEVINNLLDNSIKYTPKGSINLKLERVDKKARLTITDTGVGMDQKTMDGLFKLFSPGADSKRVNPSSTGVGLYITKAHVDAHKGTLIAKSKGKNEGSEFIVELPILV